MHRNTSPPPSPDKTWAATRSEGERTQVMAREDDNPAEMRDVGRRINAHQNELFVSCDAAEALVQQFDHLQPEFIVLHDVGTMSCRRLLAGVAAAAARPVQKLVIRRQGYGTNLATLEFVDFSISNAPLRIYITEVDADTTSRQQVARVLLNYSRLAVLMIGDMPPHQIATSLEPLREWMTAREWRNRNLLLLPLGSPTSLTAAGGELGRGTGVTVRTTPQVTRPAEAWSFVSGTWNKLRDQMRSDTGKQLPALPGSAQRDDESQGPTTVPGTLPEASVARASMAPTSAASTAAASTTAPPTASAMTPMPALRSSAHGEFDSPLQHYVTQLTELTGMVSAAIFDMASGRPVAHAGARPAATELAQHGGMLLASMAQASRGLGLGSSVPEAAITLGNHHLLLRAVPGRPGLALHAVLDKADANLTLVRLQIGRMDSLLLDTPLARR